MILFLLIAGLLGPFSIPTRRQGQVIHTIVTKGGGKVRDRARPVPCYSILLTRRWRSSRASALSMSSGGVNPDAATKARRPACPFTPAQLLGTKRGQRRPEWIIVSNLGPQPGQLNAAATSTRSGRSAISPRSSASRTSPSPSNSLSIFSGSIAVRREGHLLLLHGWPIGPCRERAIDALPPPDRD